MILQHVLATSPASDPAGSAVLMVVGAVLAAGLTFLGVVYTARQSSRANARTVAVTERQADTAGMTALVTALQTEVARLTARVDLLERDRTADREALVAVKEEARVERVGRREAIGYARDLVRLLHHAAPEVPIPTAPASVASDL